MVLGIGAIAQGVQGGVRQWEAGGEGFSWEGQKLSATAISFDIPGTIQLVGFRSQDNIIPRLPWIDDFPTDFIAERAQAHIWDNLPLKRPNLPIVDGRDTTSTGERFKRFGVSQAGTSLFFDLGTRFPANRIAFFPRQTGQDSQGRPYNDDFIRGYDLFVNDGESFNQENVPIYSLLKRADFTRESKTELSFPLQFIRYVRLDVTSANPFEIAEFQLFGSGFAPRGTYLSKVIDLGEPANFSRLHWTGEKLRQEDDSLVADPGAEAQISVQMRTGIDDTPQVYYQVVNRFTRALQEISESEYNSLSEDERGPIEDDQVNWSLWSPAFTVPGQRIDLPSPRRYFQFQISLESGSILTGARVHSLGVEHAIPPLAQQLVGEISLLEVPRPEGNVPVVPAGVVSTFAYDVIADISEGDLGFDAIRIFTPSPPEFKELWAGDPPAPIRPDSVAVGPDFLALSFAAHRVVSRTPGILRIVFAAQVFQQGTFFTAEVFDTQSGESPQKVLPGDANPEVYTNALRVLTSAESGRDILPVFQIVPRAFSPNGDGVNDRAEIAYILVQLVRPVETKVEIFDLLGRKVRTLFAGEEKSGAYTRAWHGEDEGGGLLPVGIYVVRASVNTDQGTFAHTGTVAVVY